MRFRIFYATLFSFIIIATNVYGEGYLRINQLGYLPASQKVAVYFSNNNVRINTFEIHDALTDELIEQFSSVKFYGAFGNFNTNYRLNFSSFQKEGAFYIVVGDTKSHSFRISYDVYDGISDFLLKYMRQQRCGYNPFLKDSCHTDDGYIIYHPHLDSNHIDVTGGWHDASDYLQYVTTSANATFQMLFAYQHNPNVFEDEYDANGDFGGNGIPDILDEAKWGLDWLIKMNPDSAVMFNQIADDRDHMGFRLPNQDSISYGKGLERPVYFCTGKPQGVMKHQNKSNGIASTAGKYASAFAMGAELFSDIYPDYSVLLKKKALQAYQFGGDNPGVCQTAPCRAPYFYEEENWKDDMELAAAVIFNATGETDFLVEAVNFGESEPITPWMGSDSAKHYQWYPFINLGHYYLARNNSNEISQRFKKYYEDGIDLVFKRAEKNVFLNGIPFIWCSNNLVAAMLTQCRLYYEVTGQRKYEEMENALFDWLFGCNPWGTSMIVGMPNLGDSPSDPHSAFTHLNNYKIDGGLVDGPVYSTIYNKLLGITLFNGDEYAEFQSDLVVYHDDYGDYSSNEPTMDGTASLSYYFSYREAEGIKQNPNIDSAFNYESGGIIRTNIKKKELHLVFTGGDFADGAQIIIDVLNKHGIKSMFFFTGDFYRTPENENIIKKLIENGHYLGAHSDKHLLYAPWEKRDSLLLTQEEFIEDLKSNYEEMRKFGIEKNNAKYFLPPYEWYNQEIANWTNALGLTLINYTPGTYSNADYTYPEQGENYLSSQEIFKRILKYEEKDPNGLNGFFLLTHVGTDERRSDKFYNYLDKLISELKVRGYSFTKLE